MHNFKLVTRESDIFNLLVKTGFTVLVFVAPYYNALGQTYTTTGNSTNWNDPSAWVKTNPDGCSTFSSTAAVPPLGPAFWPYCNPVKIVINHPITYSGNTNIGGGAMASLTVNNGAEVIFTGNLTVANSTPSFLFQINDGSKFKVNGTFTVQQGATFNSVNESNGLPKTKVEVGNLTLANNGSWHTVNVGENTLFKVNGNTDIVGSGTLNVLGEFETNGNLFVRNNGNQVNERVNIGGTAIFTVDGDTEINRLVKINDQAIVTFKSNVHLPNVSGASFEINDEANVLIQGNLTRAGGNIRVNDSSSLIICDDSDPQDTDSNSFPAQGSSVLVNSEAYYGGCAMRILPVEFQYFKGNLLMDKEIIKLEWATTKEWESSHFEIERSTEGLNFKKIAEVNAAGWSDFTIAYSFEDKELPISGANLLYRLKQIDFNGDYTYSKVVSIRAPGVEFTSGVWRAFPNPFIDNQLQISLLDGKYYDKETITFRLVHPSAQSMVHTVNSEAEMNEKLSQLVGRIPKGVFVVEIQWGQKIEHIKVLKR